MGPWLLYRFGLLRRRRSGLLSAAIEGASGDVREGLAHFTNACFRVLKHLCGQFGLPAIELPRPAAHATPSPGGGESGEGALAGKVTLQLGKGTADAVDVHAFGRRGIDCVTEALEPDATLFQFFNKLDKLDGLSAQAVQLPHDKRVPHSRPQEGERFIEAGPSRRSFCR
jgi:hypothetical protein